MSRIEAMFFNSHRIKAFYNPLSRHNSTSLTMDLSLLCLLIIVLIHMISCFMIPLAFSLSHHAIGTNISTSVLWNANFSLTLSRPAWLKELWKIPLLYLWRQNRLLSFILLSYLITRTNDKTSIHVYLFWNKEECDLQLHHSFPWVRYWKIWISLDQLYSSVLLSLSSLFWFYAP